MGMSDNLNQIFDIQSTEITRTNLIDTDGSVIAPNNSISQNIADDYITTRNNLHSLLMQGQDALINALEIAKQSEHPRAFEVVGSLMKQLAEINNQLLDLSEKRQKLLTPKDEKPVGNVTNNAFFVGSTAELSKLIKDNK